MDKLALIKDLRTATLAGMNDCKLALTEAEWDFNKAVDLVKARGLAQTARNAQKVAAEGRVVIHFDHAQDATMIEINSNTDFTAGSEEFLTFCQKVGEELGSTDLTQFQGDLSTITTSDQKTTLESLRQELMAKTKENIVVRRWFVEEVFGDNRRVFDYIHSSNSKLGVLLSLEGPDAASIATPEFEEFGNNVAMQIAAMNPLAVSIDQISQEEKDRQKAIFETQLKEAGKPEAAWAKIIEGKTKKWQSEVCLLDQEAVFLSDGSKKTIRVLSDELAKQLGGEAGSVKILSFNRCQVGEGIEKPKEEDYAQEIGKMAGLAEEVVQDNGVATTIHTAITNGMDVVKEVKVWSVSLRYEFRLR
jgi:elongation factor Ts